MKQLRLFFSLTALLLTAGTHAEVDVPAYGSIVGEGTFYLYSLGTQKFLNPTVNAPSLVDYDRAQTTTLTATDDGKYLMSGVAGKYLKMGVWNGQYLWSDGGAGDTRWTITPVEADYTAYQIAALDGDYTDTALSFDWYLTGSNATDIAEVADTYVFLDEGQFAVLTEALQTDKKRTELENLITEADNLGIDTSEAYAVFDNEDSTLAEIEAAMSALRQLIAEAQEQTATPDDPQDLTEQFIPNSTFEDGFDGWTTTCAYKNNQVKTGSEADGTHITGNYWENWSPTTFSGRMYTTIENLPNGVYRFQLAAFRWGGQDKVYVFAGDSRTEVLSDKADTYSVLTAVTDGTLEAGLEIVENGWVAMDNARLIYYGNSIESYKYWLQALKDERNDVDGLCQQSLLAAYEAVMQEAEQAADAATIVDAILRSQDLYAQLVENMAAYAAFKTAFDEADELAASTFGDATDALSDYLDEHEEDANNGMLSTEEITAVTERIRELADEARKTGRTAGADCTDLLANPDFTDGVVGWTVAYGTLKTGGAEVNPNAESWQTSFDMYQEITGLTNGLYQLDFSGFGRSTNTYDSWAERENPTPTAYAYINATERPLTDYSADPDRTGIIYENPDMPDTDSYVPTNLNDVARGFEAGLYKNTVYGLVTDGTMRIGIRSDRMSGHADSWAAWDTFRLTYQGKDETAIGNAIDNLADVLTAAVARGVAPSVSAAVGKAIESANAAPDADAMLSAFAALTEMQAVIKASQTKYAELAAAASQLQEAYDNYVATASAASIERLEDLSAELEAIIAAHSLEDDEIDAKLAEVAEAIKAVRLTDGYADATDDNPVDMTTMITNPSFDNDNDEGWEGTATGRAQRVGAAEFWNKNFDLHQTITGLPDGTYELTVSAFYRNGWATAEAWAAYLNGTDPVNAYLYAVTAEGQSSTPLASVWDEALDEALGGNESTTTLDDRTVYSPNDMSTALLYFEAGRYAKNRVTVRVTDGTLTIGLRKDVLISEDWTMFDNFRLTYYGTESNRTVTDDPVRVDDIAVATTQTPTAIFNLAGQRVQHPARGLYIVGGRKVLVK